MLPRRPKAVSLPPLPFGDAGASVSSDVNLYRERLSAVITSLRRYEPLGDPSAFRSKSSLVNINGMKLAAGANTAVSAEVGDTRDTTLMIPFAGENLSTIEGVGHRWVAGEGAMFIPAQGRGGGCSVRANLNIDIDPVRLQSVAQGMLGENSTAVDLRLQDARVLALQVQGFSFDRVFRQLCGMIDAHLDSPQLLEMLRVDDLFYRSIAIMMRPDLLLDDAAGGEPAQHRRLIDPLCEYLRAHLDQSLSLSDMERFSNMSARALQYAFRERFGLSPSQWLRRERLHMAHRRLKTALPGDSVTSIALACGLPHLGKFSVDYRALFKESPSETLARAFMGGSFK